MPRKKGTGTGTRNLNGMGNLYLNKSTGRMEYRIMVNGRLRVASGKTAKEVNERKKLLTNTPKDKLKIKFHAWADLWLKNYIKPYKKESTHKQYEDTWKCYIKPYIKNVPLSTVNSEDIQKLIAKMHERKLSAYTMKQTRKVLNLIFRQAIKDKYIRENPAADIEIPVVQQKTRKVLKIREFHAILRYLEKSRWYWPLQFMVVTGLRRGELLALKWSDVDEPNKIITVSDNNTSQGIGTTKSNKVHYVALSETALKCLNKFKIQLMKEGHPAQPNSDNIIFIGIYGEPLRPQSLNNVFRRIKHYTGIEATPHSMRHTFVYYCKNKLSLSELKDNLGHDETTSTLDLYGDMLFDTSRVATKIDHAFKTVFAPPEPEEPAKVERPVKKVVNLNDIKNRRK